MGIEDVLALADKVGVVALLLLALIGGFRRWWVFGWVHSECERRGDQWRELALRGLDTTKRAVDIVKADEI